MIQKHTLNKEPIRAKRALLSVFDKNKIIDIGKALIDNEIEILSTGGTADALRNNNINVTDVSDYTHFPEIMDGRIKTINPLIEGGILGLRDDHKKEAKEILLNKEITTYRVPGTTKKGGNFVHANSKICLKFLTF